MCILSEPHRLVGPERANAYQDWHLSSSLVYGCLESAAALGA
jgi:hypothetical protein